MPLTLRRLDKCDVSLLQRLGTELREFGLDESDQTPEPLSREAAVAYLDDPAVLHWVAQDGEEILGHLQCHLLRRYSGRASELLLYDIGVREHARRRGIAKSLI